MAITDRLNAHPEFQHLMCTTQRGFNRVQHNMRMRLLADPQSPARLSASEQFFLHLLLNDISTYNMQHGQIDLNVGMVIVGSVARAAIDPSITPRDLDLRLTSDIDLRQPAGQAYWSKLNDHVGNKLINHAMQGQGVIMGVAQPARQSYFLPLALRINDRHTDQEQLRFQIALAPNGGNLDSPTRNVDLLLSSEPDLLTTTELLQKESWCQVPISLNRYSLLNRNFFGAVFNAV